MQTVNLKKYYGELFKKDVFIDYLTEEEQEQYWG